MILLLLRNFTSMFTGDIGLSFSSLAVFFSGFGVRVVVAL